MHDVEACIKKVTLSCTLDESYSASTKVRFYKFWTKKKHNRKSALEASVGNAPVKLHAGEGST